MDPQVVAFSIVILLFSVIAHEVAHGWVALKFGDRTALNSGRLTLNPLPHIDPIGTVLLPIVLLISGLPMFGWAKPVPVNPLNFRDIKRGELWVSLAGVGTNLALAALGALIYHFALAVAPTSILPRMIAGGVVINLMLAVFNLIPVPPLDGSRALIAILPYQAARRFEALEKYGFLILFGLLFFPPTRMIFNFILGFVVGGLLGLMGVGF